jgi:hypothetical protein
MKIRFDNEEYLVGHWKQIGHSYQRILHNVKTRNHTFHSVYIILCNRVGEPLKYKVLGEGYMTEVCDKFNKVYNYPTFNEKQVEIAKMNLTNFIIKYKKLYSFT